MTAFIQSADVNILDGVLEASIPIAPGLTLLSGENGTLKTKLLQEIKKGRFTLAEGTEEAPRILAISPKRNSERRAIDQIFQVMRRESRTLDKYLQERGKAQINDKTFENYSSVGELFCYVHEARSRDGTSQIEHMNQVTNEFNQAIGSVFPNYSIESEWDADGGMPRLFLLKKQLSRIPIEALSTGEQEVLSLITNLFASRDAYDLILIDEPEVHLNWHLEDRLFQYLNQFCDEFEKQIVVSTHSRVVFKPEFLPKTIFLRWDDEGHVVWTDEISPDYRRRIAGETIEIIRLGDFSNATFFVEDNEHEQVLQELASNVNAYISVTICGNAQNVRTFFKHSKVDGGWKNAYFVEDGDNENSPFPGEPSFIHLPVYCIENHLLNVSVLAGMTGRIEDEIRELLFRAILYHKDRILGKNKFLDFLLAKLSPEDLTDELLGQFDGSLLLPFVLQDLGLVLDAYVAKFVEFASAQGVLDQVFTEQLVNAVLGAASEAE